MRRKVITLRRAVVVIVILFIAMWGCFSGTSICSICGATQSETQWQVPFAELTYWRTKSVSNTCLSTLANNSGLCPPHTHRWIFAHGGGNGITCAIGQGRHIGTAALNPQWAEILSAVATYRDKETASKWLKISLDPKRSMSFVGLLLHLPEGGFHDRETFETWWKSNVTETEKLEPNFFAAPN